MDLRKRVEYGTSGKENEDDRCDVQSTISEERYDSYGAMDLSSSCSGSALEDDCVSIKSLPRKRKASDRHDESSVTNKTARKTENSMAQKMNGERYRMDGDNRNTNGVSEEKVTNGHQSRNSTNSTIPKARNMRKNIKEVMGMSNLNNETKEAQAEEQLRINRLQQIQALQKASLARSGIESDDSLGNASEEVEEDVSFDNEDPTNSGMHVNDALNVAREDGSVVINVGHPDEDEDILLAPQLAALVKPHQIGGLRFLYDNIIQSVSRYKENPGFGCILAHNMGLGKTLQIISFIDIFLDNTDTKKVLCIVPINTIQNWLAEFNYWLPAEGEYSSISDKVDGKVKTRNFQIYVLNDSLKNLAQRGSVINSWDRNGGVLLMGYELYRQLANRRHRRKRHKVPDHGEQEEDNQSKHILEEVQQALVNPGPDLVVCDEGHRIKNSHASISQALKQIKTKRRIVLTGYPLQNNLMEYWCMVDFVRPNYLGNKTEFTNMFERPIQNGQCIDSTPKDVRLMKHRAHVLHDQLKGFVQRRSHVVLKNSLPEKTEHVLFVRLTKIQRTLYKRFMEELISNRCVSNPLKAFAVCCKIWNHPDVLYNFLKKREEVDLDYDPEEFLKGDTGGGAGGAPQDLVQLLSDGKKEEINYDWAQGMLDNYEAEKVENSSKLQIFLAILEECVRVGDRLLLFSQSLCTLNLIEQFLQKRKVAGQQENWKNGVNYYRLDGSTSAQERERLINRFNGDKSIQLFLVSTRAGSLGVNLVGANRVVIFDASWNPCHDTQAVCRVYRYGQEKLTHIYRLVTDNSLEKKIYDRQINKQGMSDRIVDELNPDANLSSKEVHSLICDEEDDPQPVDMSNDVTTFNSDTVMRQILAQFSQLLTKVPVSHESQLVDRKDNKLSRAEKKLAERSYKLEKTSKITYSRPSYAAFYPKQGTFATNLHNPGSNGFTRNRYFENGKKVENWAPSSYNSGVSPMISNRMQNDKFSSVLSGNNIMPVEPATMANPFPTPTFSNVLSAPPPGKALETPPNTNGDWTRKIPKSDDSWGKKQPESQSSEHNWSKPNSSGVSSAPPPPFTNRSRDSPVISSRPGSSAQPNNPQPATTLTSSTSNGLGLPVAKPSSSTNSMLETLSKQGIELQQLKVPRDVVIPTNPGEPPIRLSAGQEALVIRTGKGMYLKMEEKIIKIKQQSAMNGLFSSVGNGSYGAGNDTLITVNDKEGSTSSSENETDSSVTTSASMSSMSTVKT